MSTHTIVLSGCLLKCMIHCKKSFSTPPPPPPPKKANSGINNWCVGERCILGNLKVKCTDWIIYLFITKPQWWNSFMQVELVLPRSNCVCVCVCVCVCSTHTEIPLSFCVWKWKTAVRFCVKLLMHQIWPNKGSLFILLPKNVSCSQCLNRVTQRFLHLRRQLKLSFTQHWKLFTRPHVIPNRMTFFLQWNTQGEVLKNILVTLLALIRELIKESLEELIKCKTVTWMQCKSLWIKASAKCINVNVND